MAFKIENIVVGGNAKTSISQTFLSEIFACASKINMSRKLKKNLNFNEYEQ